jgi:chorismate dehydratase
MERPRVSVVKYLNTVPLIWGMLHGRQRGKYDLDFTTPAACADAVLAGKADVGIVPSIEYQRIDDLEILPGLSIASKAPVKSVLLLSAVPIENIRSVSMDNSSRTSVALTAILLRNFYRLQFDSIPAAPDPDQMLRLADAALVIGDPALIYKGQAPHVYDVAAEWKKFTGLPFVFAVWAGRSGRVLGDLLEDFADSCAYGLDHVDEIATAYGPVSGITPEQVKIYLTRNIDYTLDEENLRALSLFYRLARELGITETEKELRFAEAGKSSREFLKLGWG